MFPSTKNGAFIILLVSMITRLASAQDNEEFESTTVIDIPNDENPSSTENQVQLDSRLRTALLKALTDLEKEENAEEHNEDSAEDAERDVAKAQASAVTIFEDEKSTSLEGETGGSETKGMEDVREAVASTTTEPEEEDPSKQRAEIVILQKSESLQGHTITSFDENPLDPVKDVENIITSASNNFGSEHSDHQSVVRSFSKTFATENSQFQSDLNSFESGTKTSSFASFNAISDDEPKKPSKASSKNSIGKAVNKGDFAKTYIKSDTDYVKYSPINVTPNTETFDAKSSEVKAFEREILNEKHESAEVVTEKVAEVSTEESEAKVEHVQFFSAPLVAAFTVHQDEEGQPRKVEPIYKSFLNSKKELSDPLQQSSVQQRDQAYIQPSTFENLDLQQKQEILEQELNKLRKQQLLNKNHFTATQNYINLDANEQPQYNFKQDINQNINKFDPVFNEPDRSVVTKLATIDPSKFLRQNPEPLLNRFTPNEAILSRGNSDLSVSTNQIVPEPRPTLSAPKASSDVSLVPSISFDPLVEAGKLPKNAQILPNKEPTGFHNFINPARPENQHTLPQHNLVYNQLNQNNIISNAVPRPQQNIIIPSQNNVVRPSSGLIQPSVNNFISPNIQNLESNGLNNQPDKLSRQQPSQTFGTQLTQNNQNRFLRQELGTANLGSNQQSISIVPADQPFAPIHELGYFPNNNGFLRQPVAIAANPQPNLIQQTQNFNSNHLNIGNYRNNIDGNRNINTNNPNTGLQGFPVHNSAPSTQSQHRFFRSNLEGTLTSPQKVSIQSSIQPNIQHFNSQPLGASFQNNKFFRSNQESSLSKPEGLSYVQPQTFSQVNRFLRSNQETALLRSQNGLSQPPVLQRYKYSSSFGFPTIPLH